MRSQQRTRKRITESNGNSSTVPWRRVVDAIARKRGVVAPDRAVLVGISGVDASGKGFITAKLAERLGAGGWNVAAINADDWLNLPEVCINRDNYAEHFYEHAIRFDEMFEQLVLPLRKNREISLIADCADAKATSYRSTVTSFAASTSLWWKEFSCLSPPIGITSISQLGLTAHSSVHCRGRSRAAKKVCGRQKRSGHLRQSIFPHSEFIWGAIILAKQQITLL